MISLYVSFDRRSGEAQRNAREATGSKLKRRSRMGARGAAPGRQGASSAIPSTLLSQGRQHQRGSHFGVVSGAQERQKGARSATSSYFGHFDAILSFLGLSNLFSYK